MPTESRVVSETVVAVTGASSGIGAATARLLLEAGAKVAVQARRRERLDALADEFGADDVLVVTGDVQNPDSATELVMRAVERFGRLDSIVVNAGIGMYGGILDRSDAELQTMMRTNVEGTVWAVRAAVAEFRRHPGAGGDVVVVASVAGLRGGADETMYAATEFAQVGLSGALDREVRPEGIRVTNDLPRRRSHRVRDWRRPHRGGSRTRRLPATRGRRPRDHHRAATAAAGSYHPVAAVEHGAEQLTPRLQSAGVASNGQHRGAAAARQAS
jgi:NADP-dependent 3-hydroxy acid dehydrogenase YdfG